MNVEEMYNNEDGLWDTKKSENAVSGIILGSDEENETTSRRTILMKRKTKSVSAVQERSEGLMDSPPAKRIRTSLVLQQTKLVSAFNFNGNLNKLGFEDEYEDEDHDSKNVQSRMLHNSRISLPFPSAAEEKSKISQRRTSVASGASKSRKASLWKKRIGTDDSTGFSIFKSPIFDRERSDVCTGIDLADNGTGKNKSEEVSEKMDVPIKLVHDLSFKHVRKPLLLLKRTEIHAGVTFIDNMRDTLKREFGYNGDKRKDCEFPKTLSESNGNSRITRTFSCEKNHKIQSNSLSESKELCRGRKSNHKYTVSGNIPNVIPKMTFSTQRSETLEAVYHRLHTSEIPERLPCREAEFEQICAFIKESITNDAVSQAMYISGVPGTGKTATVLQAVRHLKTKCFSAFDFVMVNAMELPDPNQIFVKIYQHLFSLKKKIAPKTARKKLNDTFQYRDRKRLPIIILVDELDLLSTKKQEIIYDIFNWSANEESLVSIIAIANTLDLPERLLSQRISSRLGANRLCFQPYDHDEVAYIIRDRLCGSTAVEAEAVELASRKIAAISGDLRKALDILRSATELAISANQSQLTMKNVQEAIRQASTNVRVELIRALPRHSILLLRAAVAEQLSSGVDEFQFHILFKQYRLQCSVANVNPVSTSAAYRNVMEMCSERLLVAASGTGSMSRRFRLGMTAHDVQFAFKQVDESVF
uniref:Origin recognition complex subunit 1 n=1 Tax=Setaria digitata TaxID=48799 RepID=A0A915Q8D4_9BILA